MNKILYILLAAIALQLSSCENEDIIENEDSNLNSTKFTFSLNTDGSNDTLIAPKRWIMEVWDISGNNKVNCFGPDIDSHRSENSYGTFTLSLDTMKAYTCLFWADNGTPTIGNLAGSNVNYNADNLKAISLATGVDSHTKDAYFANTMVSGSNTSLSIKLKRAVAEAILIEASNNPIQDITVTYKTYSTFNILTKSMVDTDYRTFTHTFPKSEFSIIGDEKRLGSFLAFANDSETGTKIDIAVNELLTEQNDMITGVKLQPNETTNIKRNFFKDIETIKSINIAPKDDNALRVDINIEFDKAVQYHLEYWKSDDETSKTRTKSKKSDGFTSETLIFLEPKTHYIFKVIISNGSESIESKVYDFTTDALPAELARSMVMEENYLEKELSGYIVQMRSMTFNYATIFNMQGVMLWYQDMGKRIGALNFDAKTNTIACLLGETLSNSLVVNQEIVVIDLMGEQLLHKAFTDLYAHHDILHMPDGNLILVNAVPKTFDLTPLGGEKDDIVWGDGYTIVDMSGEIKEKWDCFGELSPLNDPEIMKSKKDWLHANSINFDSEGNLYMSFNWPSELWKISSKSGEVLYRIGKNGNIHIEPNGYTSGIHALISIEPNKILLLDNGNDNEISRAMIYSIDEKTKNVEVTLNVPLPSKYHTKFMGNVEIINDDLLMFNSSNTQSVVFTDYEGNIQRVLKLEDTHRAYRSIYIPEIIY